MQLCSADRSPDYRRGGRTRVQVVANGSLYLVEWACRRLRFGGFGGSLRAAVSQLHLGEQRNLFREAVNPPVKALNPKRFSEIPRTQLDAKSCQLDGAAPDLHADPLGVRVTRAGSHHRGNTFDLAAAVAQSAELLTGFGFSSEKPVGVHVWMLGGARAGAHTRPGCVRYR